MVKTAAEIQRAYRERKKARELAERRVPQPTADLATAKPSRPFSEFIKEREDNLMLYENLHWIGADLSPDLTSERPKLEREDDWQEMGLEVNSLTLAIAMVGIFTDAAKELSILVNEYKLEEIDRQMADASPIKREQLERLRKRLGKRTSYFLPVIEEKGA